MDEAFDALIFSKLHLGQLLDSFMLGVFDFQIPIISIGGSSRSGSSSIEEDFGALSVVAVRYSLLSI